MDHVFAAKELFVASVRQVNAWKDIRIVNPGNIYISSFNIARLSLIRKLRRSSQVMQVLYDAIQLICCASDLLLLESIPMGHV